jgi:hypothetical protein
MKVLSLMIFAAVTVASLHSQQGRSCKSSPNVVSECFKIHGRVRVVNGAGTVIWRIGTDRLLEVEDEELIPDNLSEALYKHGDVYGRDVFGDFEVCPFTRASQGRCGWYALNQPATSWSETTRTERP